MGAAEGGGRPLAARRESRRGSGEGAMKRLALAVALLLLAGVRRAVVYWRSRPPALPPPPTAAELQALTERRDALQARLRDAVVASGEKSFAEAPARRRDDRHPDELHPLDPAAGRHRPLRRHDAHAQEPQGAQGGRRQGQGARASEAGRALRPRRPDPRGARDPEARPAGPALLRGPRGGEPAGEARRGDGQRRHPPAVGQQGPRRQRDLRRHRRHQDGDGRSHPAGLRPQRGVPDRERRRGDRPAAGLPRGAAGPDLRRSLRAGLAGGPGGREGPGRGPASRC